MAEEEHRTREDSWTVETVSFDATADVFDEPGESHGFFLADFFDFS